MPSPELIDERYDEIVRELRTLPGAPERLRERVRELATHEPPAREPSSGWVPKWITFRTFGWTVATAGAGFVAVALAYGVITSGGGGGNDEMAASEAPAAKTVPAEARDAGPATGTIETDRATEAPAHALRSASPSAASGTQGKNATTLPPGQRLAHHTATMRLRVSDVDELSRTTREAMRIARRFGGFVASVNYAKPKGDDGDASLTLRVPTAKIQEAIGQLSDLGVIVSQRIEITDVQNQVNDTTEEIASLRRTIRRIEARLKQPISVDERFRLELQLEQARANLRRLTEQRASAVRRARLAKISVTLTTREEEQKVAPPPSRIERAARNAATVLAKELAAVVYVLIVISPLLLLGAAAFVASRAHRRRFDQRLLEQA
jgi:type III secretory pathway lipoprotein EscJ